MKNRTVIIIFCATIGPFILFGQHYKTALGFRFSGDRGLTYQQSIGNKLTLESLMTVPQVGDQFQLSIILEKHINIIGRRFNAYFGVGPQTAFMRKEKLFVANSYGINTIAGLEWSIRRLNCSVDVKPLIHVAGKSNAPLIEYQPGISIRYVLIKRDGFWDKAKKKIRRIA